MRYLAILRSRYIMHQAHAQWFLMEIAFNIILSLAMHAMECKRMSFLTDFNIIYNARLLSLDSPYVPNRFDPRDRVIVKDERSANERFSLREKKCAIDERFSRWLENVSSCTFTLNWNAWNTNLTLPRNPSVLSYRKRESSCTRRIRFHC